MDCQDVLQHEIAGIAAGAVIMSLDVEPHGPVSLGEEALRPTAKAAEEIDDQRFQELISIFLHFGHWYTSTPPYPSSLTSIISQAFFSISAPQSGLLILRISELQAMRPRIVPGTILLFDEFWGFEGWERLSEARAFYEFQQNADLKIECLGVHQEQVLFRIKV